MTETEKKSEAQEEFYTMNPMPNKVLVHNMEKGEQKIGSIFIRDDNAKAHGVRPRWAQVYKVGEGVTDIKEGEWILIEHGRWSRSLDFNKDLTAHDENYVLHQVDYPDAVLLVSDDKPNSYTVGVGA